MPELQRLYPELNRAGVDLVGVSVDLDTLENVPAVLASRKVTYPVYTTSEAGLDQLYPTGEATVPLTLLLDGEGRVLEVHSGWSVCASPASQATSSIAHIPCSRVG